MEVPLGILRISPARPTDVTAACAVLTRAFAGQESIALSGAIAYATQLMACGRDKGVMLVARLTPKGERGLQSGGGGESLFPKWERYLLVREHTQELNVGALSFILRLLPRPRAASFSALCRIAFFMSVLPP